MLLRAAIHASAAPLTPRIGSRPVTNSRIAAAASAARSRNCTPMPGGASMASPWVRTQRTRHVTRTSRVSLGERQHHHQLRAYRRRRVGRDEEATLGDVRGEAEEKVVIAGHGDLDRHIGPRPSPMLGGGCAASAMSRSSPPLLWGMGGPRRNGRACGHVGDGKG